MGQMNSSKVGKTISFLRKHYNMTQHELAEKLGVTDKAVSRWENGYGTPDISLLSKLAVVLDIDIESLLEGNLTHWDMKWEGVLFLNYPRGILPIDYMYGIRIVEFQLSLFVLAGIAEITICGCADEINATKQIVGDGREYGCTFSYTEVDGNSSEEDIITRINKSKSLMIIDGLGFVYGKDLTKTFRRIIYDGDNRTNIIAFNGDVCGISFCEINSWRTDNIQQCVLERGTIAFAIKSVDDLMDASNIIGIIEKHQKDRIGFLSEIARRRGFVACENIEL